MAFFRPISNLVNAAKRKFNEVFHRKQEEVESDIRQVEEPQRSIPTIVFTRMTGLDEAAGRVTALYRIFADGDLSDAMLSQIAERMKDQIIDELDPISRSGRLQRSIKTRRISGGYEVYSDSGYALKLTEPSAMREVPKIGDLLSWMDYKPEFAGMSFREKRSKAFAIRTSIATGTGLGRTGHSDITRLGPSGQRAFDYVRDAYDEIRPEIEDLGYIADYIIN